MSAKIIAPSSSPIVEEILSKINLFGNYKFKNFTEPNSAGYCALGWYFFIGDKIRLSPEERMYLIAHSPNSPNPPGNQKNSLLMSALSGHLSRGLNITHKEWDYLIAHADLSVPQHYHRTPLAYALRHDPSPFNFLPRHWEYLIKNSNLKSHQYSRSNILSLVLSNNDINKNSVISSETMDYLIDNTDFKEGDFKNKWTPLLLAFEHFRSAHLTEKQLAIIIEKSPTHTNHSITASYFFSFLENNHSLPPSLEKIILDKDPFIIKKNNIYSLNINYIHGNYTHKHDIIDSSTLSRFNKFIDRFNTYSNIENNIPKTSPRITKKI